MIKFKQYYLLYIYLMQHPFQFPPWCKMSLILNTSSITLFGPQRGIGLGLIDQWNGLGLTKIFGARAHKALKGAHKEKKILGSQISFWAWNNLKNFFFFFLHWQTLFWARPLRVTYLVGGPTLYIFVIHPYTCILYF